MYPMKLKPIYDKTIWANDRLTTMRGMEEKGMGTCWEISAHPYAKNVILNGEYAGKTLDEVIQANPQSILGEKQLHQMLRLAYLDAREDLSIQVHPYDEYARAHENDEGKTESWYILEADKGATLVAGTTASDAAVIKAAVENDQVEDYVRKVEVEAGDFVCIDAGMLHALGKGILALEIGQNSNTTYRVYDFGRVGKDGKTRELNIEKAIDVSNLTPLESDFKPIGEEKDYGTYKCAMMATCEYFTTYVYDVKTECSVKVDEESFASFVIVDGEGSIESDDTMLSIRKGDSVFASANTGKVTIKGSCRFILSKV